MPIDPSSSNAELIRLLSQIFLNPNYPNPGGYGQNPIPRPPNDFDEKSRPSASPQETSPTDATQAFSPFNHSYYQLAIDITLVAVTTAMLTHVVNNLDSIPFVGRKIRLALKTMSYLGVGLAAYFGIETKKTII